MKKFKSLLAYLDLDYKKEIRNIILITLALLIINIASFLFLKQMFLSLIFLIFSVVIIYLYISRYSSLKTKLIKERKEELISIISYFEIFILNNYNVYNSIQSLLPYCSGWMSDKISSLLEKIDEDKSVVPFIEFSKEFDDPIIENLLISIYQMIEEGENTNGLTQFSFLFKEINKKHQEENLEKKISSLDSMNVFPLIGAGSITIILTIGVLSIVGDLINVL